MRPNLRLNINASYLCWLIPVCYFCVGLVYLYAAPHFEASDSVQHIGVIEWIAERGQLPVQSAEHDQMFGQEASQPPLYYLLMAPIWRAFDTSDFADYYRPNPLVIAGVPERLGNRNQVFYRQPYPPDLSGASLAIYVMRLLTLGMSTVTVAAVYQSARIVLPDHKGFALLAGAMTAFNPQFIFIGTSISNDSLVTMLAALITWQMLVMLRDGFQTRRSLLLALLIALASLAKLSGLAPGAVVLLAGFWLAWRRRDWRGLLIFLVATMLCWLVIAGWWFARNLVLYDELFGTAAMLDNYGRRSTTLARLYDEEFTGFRISFWGLFGAFSNLTHELHYRAMDVLSVVAAVGVPLFLYRFRGRRLTLTAVFFLAVSLALGMGMLLAWTIQTTASTGRLLFPYITSIGIFLAMGLTALRIPPLLIAAPMFAFSLAAPFLYIIPTYDHPQQVEEVPDSAILTFAQWDDVTLIGHQAPSPQRWTAGDEIPITLYWRPLKQSDEPLALFISLIGSPGEAIATLDTFPGWGSLPTTWWQPGQIYRDDYILQIPKDAEGYSTLQLHVGWYAYPDGSNINPLLENGETASAYFIPMGAIIAAQETPRIPEDAIVNGTVFGDAMQLKAYNWRDGNRLELHWQLLDEMSGDWRVMASVFAEPFELGEAFEVLMQDDETPAVPLGYLRSGETFSMIHIFDDAELLAGDYSVYIAWYNNDSGERLATAYPADMLELPGISVERSDEA